MIRNISFASFFLLSTLTAQTDLENGILYYNKRHEGCVEDKADRALITKAISYFEDALKNDSEKNKASLYLLKSYYFSAKFAEDNKQIKKELLKKGKELGQDLVARFPESAEYRYWYLVNLGSWAEVYGILAAAREGVADQMRSHSKRIIEIDPEYENGAGYFMLGAVHYKSPYIPFLLSWPNNTDAIKWLEMSYNTGNAKLAQGVYLAQALYKDDKIDNAIILLDKIISASPSKDDYASDWEWIKKAKVLHAEYQ
tara:strand:+ start:2248 stop:3015 length:768 start_codon:yes stop_codon:yes gene_type:complete